ncbi:unnamed protein product, partial [Protopolystoma xenopodis]
SDEDDVPEGYREALCHRAFIHQTTTACSIVSSLAEKFYKASASALLAPSLRSTSFTSCEGEIRSQLILVEVLADGQLERLLPGETAMLPVVQAWNSLHGATRKGAHLEVHYSLAWLPPWRRYTQPHAEMPVETSLSHRLNPCVTNNIHTSRALKNRCSFAELPCWEVGLVNISLLDAAVRGEFSNYVNGPCSIISKDFMAGKVTGLWKKHFKSKLPESGNVSTRPKLYFPLNAPLESSLLTLDPEMHLLFFSRFSVTGALEYRFQLHLEAFNPYWGLEPKHINSKNFETFNQPFTQGLTFTLESNSKALQPLLQESYQNTNIEPGGCASGRSIVTSLKHSLIASETGSAGPPINDQSYNSLGLAVVFENEQQIDQFYEVLTSIRCNKQECLPTFAPATLNSNGINAFPMESKLPILALKPPESRALSIKYALLTKSPSRSAESLLHGDRGLEAPLMNRHSEHKKKSSQKTSALTPIPSSLRSKGSTNRHDYDTKEVIECTQDSNSESFMQSPKHTSDAQVMSMKILAQEAVKTKMMRENHSRKSSESQDDPIFMHRSSPNYPIPRFTTHPPPPLSLSSFVRHVPTRSALIQSSSFTSSSPSSLPSIQIPDLPLRPIISSHQFPAPASVAPINTSFFQHHSQAALHLRSSPSPLPTGHTYSNNSLNNTV